MYSVWCIDMYSVWCIDMYSVWCIDIKVYGVLTSQFTGGHTMYAGCCYPENQQKHSLAGTMPSVPQPLYPGPQHRVPALPDLGMGHKMPPAYLGGPEPPKLNHLAQGPPGGGVGAVPGMAHQMSSALNPHFLPPHFGR